MAMVRWARRIMERRGARALQVVAGLAAKSNERFAYDSYRRLLDMFGDVVMGVHHRSCPHEVTNGKPHRVASCCTSRYA